LIEMGMAAHRSSIGSYEIVRRLDAPDREIYVTRRVEGNKRREYVVAVFDVPAAHFGELEREIARCRRLQHAAVAKVVEVIAHEGKAALVFESVAGASLLKLLRHLEEQGERLAQGAILFIAMILMEALSEAHTATDEAGRIAPIVHGELGPHQVFISWDGEVKILGFGLSPIFQLSTVRDGTPEWAKPFVAPEVRSGGMLTPRANAYSAAALVWSLLARRPPPTDSESLPSLLQMCPELAPPVSSSLDRALEPSIRKRVTCQAVARALARVVKREDQQELRWCMEILRALSAIDDDVLPLETFPSTSLSTPPLSSLPPVSSAPPPGTEPPDSDEATTPFFKVPPHLQHIKLPEQVIAPEEPDEPSTLDEPVLPAAAAKPREASAVVGKLGGRRSAQRTLLGTGAELEEVAKVAASQAKPSELRAKKPVRMPGTNGASRLRADTAKVQEAPREPTTRVPAAEQGVPDTTTQEVVKPSIGDTAARERREKRLREKAPEPREPVASGIATSRSERARRAPTIPPKAGPQQSDTMVMAKFDTSPELEFSEEPEQPRRPSVEIPPPPPLVDEAEAPPSVPMAPLNPSASTAPHPGVPLTGAPPTGPYSIAPSLGPGMSIAPGAVVLPVRWLSAVTMVVAITAIASFALGLFLGGGGVGPWATRPTAAPAPETAPVAPSEPKASGTAVAANAPAPAPAPRTEAAPPAETAPASDDGLDGSNLEPVRGYLVVTSSRTDAAVYVQGRYVGKVGHRIDTLCGVRFVRLGTYPLQTWIGKGRPVGVVCQGTTRVTIEPGAYDADSGGKRGKDGRWMPEGL
jgi:hypothetical protein